MNKFGFFITLVCGLFFFSIGVSAQTVAISQFFGGSGSATGAYTRDYVELKNVSNTTQSLNGLALQYGSSSGNFGSAASLIYPLENVTLQPGQYYLVGLATGTGIAALPTAVDNTTANTINMSGTQGKVALTNTTVALGCGATATPCVLPDARIIDLAAWGGSNNAEGGASVNNGVNITAAQGGVRKTNGCQDTNNNNTDFDVASPPVPRNTASPVNVCGAVAANVGIGGRVQDGSGIGLRNIQITLTDEFGIVRNARTNAFGYFLFEDLEAGNTYILNFNSKQYQFASRIITATEDVTNIEITPIK